MIEEKMQASTKLGWTKTMVIALVVIVAVGGIAIAYILLWQPSAQSSSPSANTHTVEWATMADHQTDFWNITITKPYTLVLEDSMTVSSGSQWLSIQANNSTQPQNTAVWQIYFVNSSSFRYTTFSSNGSTLNRNQMGCNNGHVQVVVTDSTITFIGTSSVTLNVPFTDIGQIVTSNSDGDFNGGDLKIEAH